MICNQPKSVVPNTTEVSDDELDFETTGFVVTGEDVVVTSVEQVMEEDINDVEILKEISAPPKEGCDEVKQDHSYGVSKSPGTLKRQIDELLDANQRLKKKLRISQQKARRLTRKVDTLTSVVDDLKANNLVSSSCAKLLEATFSAVPRELISQKANKNPKAYPPELRAFA